MKLIKRAHRQERSLAKHLEKNKDVPESLNKGTRDRRQELAGGCQDVLNFQGAQVVQVAAAASPEEDDEEQISGSSDEVDHSPDLPQGNFLHPCEVAGERMGT
ncbi:uncharacterized protein LOC142592696 isoform X4 [Dermacentor variabilis]|uniref:uncharacterized protein LOC142592696 isoform X4 n=1 Tax=Dermacentor variabilis TaxID=34621 RepID=UPI003F5C2E44